MPPRRRRSRATACGQANGSTQSGQVTERRRSRTKGAGCHLVGHWKHVQQHGFESTVASSISIPGCQAIVIWRALATSAGERLLESRPTLLNARRRSFATDSAPCRRRGTQDAARTRPGSRCRRPPWRPARLAARRRGRPGPSGCAWMGPATAPACAAPPGRRLAGEHRRSQAETCWRPAGRADVPPARCGG